MDTRDGRWGWAFPLSHRSIVNGCLVVSAASAPSDNQIKLLTILAQQTGAALGRPPHCMKATPVIRRS